MRQSSGNSRVPEHDNLLTQHLRRSLLCSDGAFSARPGDDAAGHAIPPQTKDRTMADQTEREANIFRFVAGAAMVLLITFGVLELMNVIHI